MNSRLEILIISSFVFVMLYNFFSYILHDELYPKTIFSAILLAIVYAIIKYKKEK